MIVWDILNTLARVLLAAIFLYKIYRFPNLFNDFEMWGMGIGAGSSLLTITVIWAGQRSPYDGWSTTVFSFAMLCYFTGRMTRHWRHEANNRAQIRQGRLR